MIRSSTTAKYSDRKKPLSYCRDVGRETDRSFSHRICHISLSVKASAKAISVGAASVRSCAVKNSATSLTENGGKGLSFSTGGGDGKEETDDLGATR